MNKFWPARPKPNGFSENKSSKFLENKLIDFQKSSLVKSDKKNLKNRSSDLIQIKTETKSLASKPKKIVHWANRQFDEYRLSA
tara:strand:- start:693 stop:941 length:249 start_codon:yes stop_codon:yes gene_type:complete